MRKFIPYKQLAPIRRELRKLLKNNSLEARRVYYDYYDSCHPPTETPDAPWSNATDIIKEHQLKSGGDSIAILGPLHYELITGYSRYELRIKNEVKS